MRTVTHKTRFTSAQHAEGLTVSTSGIRPASNAASGVERRMGGDKMKQPIATKTVVIDGREYEVKVFAPKQALRKRASRANASRDDGAFERRHEALAEAAHLGVDLGPGY